MKKINGRLARRIALVAILTLSVISALFAFAPGKPALAANPATMSFQGKVVNANGTNVADGTYTFIFRLYQNVNISTYNPNTLACSADTNCWWEETDSVVVTSGTFQVPLGATCALTSACNSSHSGIDFSTQNALSLTMKFNGDAAGYMAPLISMQSVPYAFNSDKLGGIAASGFIQNTGTQQAGSQFNISGTGVANLFQAPNFDAATSNTALGIGTTNAGVITMGNVTNSTEIIKTKSSTTAFQVQNASSVPILLIDSTNSEVNVQGINSIAVFGSELLSSSTCSGTNWAGSGTGPYTHSTGSTVVLSCTPPATVSAGNTYQVVFNVGGSITAGQNVTAQVGGTPSNNSVGIATTNETEIISAGSTTNLRFTPSTNFNGTVTIVSLKQLTQIANNALSINNSNGSAGVEIRSGGSALENTLVGVNAGEIMTTGSDNTALGYNALQFTTVGANNTSIGNETLQFNTTGNNNVAVGSAALNLNTTGIDNTATGVFALMRSSTAYDNTANGYSALTNDTTGVQNSALGSFALTSTTTGSNNATLGFAAGNNNTTGSGNTYLGSYAGFQDPNIAAFVTLTNLQNATAIGYGAEVQQSASLILGGAGTNSVNIGIGTTSPDNLFSISPDIYDTGAASTAASTLVNGTGGASWNANMVGDDFIFANGNKYTIVGFNSTTQLVLSASSTNTSQVYRIHNPAFYVSSTGNAAFRTSTNSTTAFQVQSASATPILTIDSTNSLTSLQGISSTAVLGSEQANNTFSTTWSGTGWTLGASTATHNTGTNALSQTTPAITIVSGTTYQVTYTVAGVGAGSVYASLGGVNGTPLFDDYASFTQLFTATSTATLNINPTTNFSGIISAVSVKSLTKSKPILDVNNSDGSVGIEIRSGGIGLENTIVGNHAGQSLTTGNQIVAVGVNALTSNTTGQYDTALGYSALTSNTTGNSNTAIGAYALLSNISGIYNNAFGVGTLQSNTIGVYNSGLGVESLKFNTIGSSNVAVGTFSLQNNTSGSSNSGIGTDAGNANITGSNNTFIGSESGYQDPAVAAFVTATTLQNATAIGYGAQVQQNNSLILGGQDNNAVNVGIGTTAPTNTFSVSPDIYDTGTAWQSGNTISGFAGSGVVWTANMVGNEFIFSSANGSTILKETITGFTNSTTLTGSVSQAVSSTPGIAYRIHNPAFFVSSTGSTGVRTSTNSTTAFQVQNATGNELLTVDTTNSIVALGKKGTTGINGSLVFNTTNASNTTITLVAASTATSYTLTLPTAGPSTSQCLQTDSVTASQLKFASCAGGGSTLASSYNSAATTGNTITVASAGGAVIIKDAATSIGTIFNVQNNGGSSLLNVDAAGSNITLLGNNSAETSGWTSLSVGLGPTGTITRRELASVYANGYAYAIGGWDTSNVYQSTVYISKVNADGTLGTWTTNGAALPQPLRDEKAVYANGYIYVTGGATTAGALQATVYYGKVNTDGTISSWTTSSNPLPGILYKHAAVVANGYIYILGGNNGSDVNTVNYAKLNADGSTSGWTLSGNTIAAGGRADLSAVYANGYIYVMGGSSTNMSVYSQLNSQTGAPGAFNTTSTTLVQSAKTAGAFVLNGYIYNIGGFRSGTTTTGTISSAPILSTGSLGTWADSTTTLLAAREQAGVFTANGYIYVIGGYDGTNVVSTSYVGTTSRLKIGGSLDLVGLQGENLADASSGAGSLTAGNGIFTGTLNVQDQVTLSGSLTVGGNVLISNNTNSTSAFQVNNATSIPMFGVNTSNSRVQVGSSTAHTTNPTLFATDNYNNATEPTEVDGAIYYNASTKQFRCGLNTSWVSCIGGLTASSTTTNTANTCTTACAPIGIATNGWPANSCVAGRVFHIYVSGIFGTTSTAPTLNLGVYLGTSSTKASDTIIGVTSNALFTLPVSLTSFPWNGDIYISCVSTTTALINGSFNFMTNNTTGTSATIKINETTVGGTVATTLNNIYLFPTWGASNAANTIQANQMIVSEM